MIKFLYFEDDEGNQVNSIKIYLGNLNINEWLDDVEAKMSIVDGKIKFEILDPENYEPSELKEIYKELNNLNWDNGYEFIDFFDIETGSSYLLYGDRQSNVFNTVSSPQNINNLKKFEDVLEEDEEDDEKGIKDNLELIEESIIDQLNLADRVLNKEDFERLAESIIEYVDEIGRSKRK